MVRPPAGFVSLDVPTGEIHYKEDANGWVVLAGDPDVKFDNKHRDRRPHMHVGGWNSETRVDLRPDLELHEVLRVLKQELAGRGWLDVSSLEASLS